MLKKQNSDREFNKNFIERALWEAFDHNDKGHDNLIQKEVKAFGGKNNIQYSDRNKTSSTVAKNKHSKYNEYNTNAMIWAYNSDTKAGDLKIFHKPRIGKYALIKATKKDIGFIELIVGTLKQVEEDLKEYERYRKESTGLDTGETASVELADGFKMRRRDEDWHSVNVSDSGRRGRADGIYGRTSGQFDGAEGTTEIGRDNNEGIIYSDREESLSVQEVIQKLNSNV